ncbi:MAG: ATP-binding protein, partial [Gammaproteobacteria bacterium]|nr:ATP-binding protein [Gammaproteobacteria bacterium]
MILEEALREELPIVAILGQSTGYADNAPDSVLRAAIQRLNINGSAWSDVFSKADVDDTFLSWLNERFERRPPANELTSVADVPVSAVFTSSFDPTLRKLFETDGRQPEAILVGDPPPPTSRSKLRPKIHYLFGMTGAGVFSPPASRLDMNTRRTKHAIPMLNTVLEAATALGIVVVDGIGGTADWLGFDEIAGAIGSASTAGVLWFGPDPDFSADEHALFQELIDQRLIVRDQRTLGRVHSEICASGLVPQIQSWTEPGVVSFAGGARLVTSPMMRLSTEASASIIDDTWNDQLIPLQGSALHDSFAIFHSIPTSHRLIFDGVRRGYAINRHFEEELLSDTTRALNNHSNERGAIVVSGQSGVGKSIALYRLAERIRARKSAAVLFAKDRIPSPVELATFLAEVDRLDQVTLLIVDALEQPRRYNMLLESVRSRGHRVVIVGSSYAFDSLGPKHDGKLISAPATLSPSEHQDLLALARRHFPETPIDDRALGSEHALAQFFWNLPYSRASLGAGLGREARYTERELRQRGKSKRMSDTIGSVGLAFLEAGFDPAKVPVFPQKEEADDQTGAPSKLIDYIMVCARLYRWVPVNIVLRAVVSDELKSNGALGMDLIRDLFGGHDLFRWRYDDQREEQLVVGARLQIEAQLICDGRLGGPAFEVDRILDLIANATRAGPEGHEETKFVADIVYSLGPDGPLRDRYRDSYYQIAEALTHLRKEKGVRNARLMLQEATLRRNYIRRNEANIDEKRSVEILDEARESVDDALRSITMRDSGLRAGKRTEEFLWVERAATYGLLASSSARRGSPADKVWSS